MRFGAFPGEVMSAESALAKIRTLIVDDEPLARSNLAVMLRHDSAIEIMGECGSGTQAIVEIRTRKPDLLFLDVQMPECDGFDVLEFLGNDLPPAVIFVTAFDQYALRAFEAGALDYLLKPFDNTRFNLALARAKERISHRREHPQKLERIVIKSTGQVWFVKVSDIDWIEAADYYSCLHVGAKTHMLRRSMADLENELDPKSFCRVHRSSIVNLDRVQRIELSVDGEPDLLLSTGGRLRMSRRYRKELENRLASLGTRSSLYRRN
jgi:two-component system, LytTR family, response regulator